MAENDFIERFDASMRRLNEVKQGIQANIEMKQQFTNNIKDSLTQINRRLAALVGEITALKNRAEELDGHVNRNTASINVVERVGFVKEGHLKESSYWNGEYIDCLIYSLLNK